jgi:HK97 family phage portal protein
LGLLDLFRSGQAAAPAGAARPEPPISAGSDAVRSETQWNGFVVGGGGGMARAGVRVDERTVLSLPATMQALRVLAGVFAATPIQYFARSGDQVREARSDDPLHTLMRDQPNSVDTAFEFWELYLGDLMLTGNFFAWISRDGAGRPVALTRLKPGSVHIAEYFDRAEGYTFFFDATLPDGSGGRFPARDVFHVRGMTRDGIYGLNPMQYMRDAFGSAIATGRHASRYFGKNAKPEVVLTTKEKTDPETRKAIKQDWKQFEGLDGESTAVLDQDLKPFFMDRDNQASQFIETRQFEVGELARIWGVPPHLIFELSRATFGNIEHQSLEFVTYHLGPHYKRLNQALTRAFAAPGHYFDHLTDDLVRADIKARMEAAWIERQMGTANANELRARTNRAPISGSAGTEYWRPGNMTLAGSPAPQGPQAATAKPQPSSREVDE